jgi:hypothetical protein
LFILCNLSSLYNLPSGSPAGRLRPARQLLAGHPPGNPKPNPQKPPYIFSFHPI